MPRLVRLPLLALAALLVPVAPTSAWACANCGCGDPTLTALGTEKPLRNRLRGSLEARHRIDVMGAPGADEIRLSEQRLDAQLAWAPHERLFLLATMPTFRRDITYDDGSRHQLWGIGDVEARAKIFLFQDRPFSPRHLVAAVGGVKLPTAGTDRRANGQPLPIELQPGTGAVDGILGASYGFFTFPWSAYVSAQGIYTTRGTAGSRASRSLRTTTALQRHLGDKIALRTSLETRLDGRALENGAIYPNSGGFIAFVAPEVLFSPATDLSLSGWVKVAVLNHLSGRHLEPFVVGGAVTYDF